MKSSIRFRFSSLLFLFFFVASIVVCSEAAESCTYELVVKTGTVNEAGTDSHIGVTLGNLGGESIQISDIEKQAGLIVPLAFDRFERGNKEKFYFTRPCLSTPVCKIDVTSDGSGPKPGWYLESVKVTTSPPGILVNHPTIDFDFNQWLAIDEPPNSLTASRNEC